MGKRRRSRAEKEREGRRNRREKEFASGCGRGGLHVNDELVDSGWMVGWGIGGVGCAC